ncbi:hypothetical protein [Pantoea sp.]|uniref:hypothetical protein n=1 Tax=Pantoea sp. TaxID=69393 RepID=UPI0028ABAD11|nr:hypothetical protein [Pantoea sp.]
MNKPVTIADFITHLQGFNPATPCVGHIWIADDFEDIAPELTPEEVMATLALADATLDADISLSWHFLRDCADTVLALREEK